MERGTQTRRSPWPAIFVGVAGVAFVVAWRMGYVARQTVQWTAGFGFISVGLFSLFRLATTEIADPKPHGTRRGAALHFVGCVLAGTAQFVMQTWVGVAVMGLAVVLMLLPWVLPKWTASRATR